MFAEYIDDEIQDAEKYAELALHYKDTDPDLARMFYQLSEEETNHMRMLYEHETKRIHEMHKAFEA